MNIGIDIDDTLTDSCPVLKSYLEKYDSVYCNDGHMIKNIADIICGHYVDDAVTQFYLDNGKQMANEIKIKKDAKEILDKLLSEGNKITIITARSSKFFADTQAFNEAYLKTNNINYTKLLTSQDNKLETCLKENIDIMIDDSIKTCERLQNEGIKSLVFTSELNKDKETNCNRVGSWLELYNYIHNM